MIISPPNNTTIEDSQELEKLENWEEVRRVQLFLNVRSWRCVCGITNFGRNLNCARDTCKKSRPSDYKKHG